MDCKKNPCIFRDIRWKRGELYVLKLKNWSMYRDVQQGNSKGDVIVHTDINLVSNIRLREENIVKAVFVRDLSKFILQFKAIAKSEYKSRICSCA